MTGKTNRTELATPAYLVLGMIQLGRGSGDEIKQTVDSSIRFFWTISHAQIYPLLGELEKAGLISVTSRAGSACAGRTSSRGPADRGWKLADTR
jgi:DNA-binding PadR family transcriptional regulator